MPPVDKYELQAWPNFSGASPVTQAVWSFPFLWRPVAVCFTLTTDATVANRTIQYSYSTPESQVAFSHHVSTLVVASSIRQITLGDDIEATSDNAAAQNLIAPLASMPVKQNMAFRLAIVDLAAADTVTSIRVYYERL